MSETEARYQKCIDTSEKVQWTINGVLGGGFDYKRRFLPESLAQVNGLDLSDAEKLKLNQIRGLTYAHLFGFVEEFIVRQMITLAARYPGEQATERRAILRFAEEEVKHQLLFEKVKAQLLQGLGGDCGLVPGAGAVAGVVLGKSELCVLVLTSMLELATLEHYTDIFTSAEEKESLDPTFVNIFKSHWIEESQHARLDELEVTKCAATVPDDKREAAIDELLEIGGAFDGLLKAQVDMDVESLERLSGRKLSDAAKDALRAAQHKAYRYTFLVSPLRNAKFREHVASITKGGVAKIDGAAAALSA